MTRFLLCIIATLLALNTQATHIDLNKEYARLDEAIAQSSRYIAQRQKKIRALERQLGAAEDTRQQYQLCYQLYLLYRPYIHSQACVYLNRCIAIAQKEGKRQQTNHCRAILAKYFVSSGFYDEARICLQDIDTTMLDRQGQALYDMARYALYGELAYYTTLPEMKRHYETLRNDYEKAMMPLLSKDNDVYCETRQNQLTTQGKAREALHFNDQWLKRTPSGSHDYAMVTLYRYLAYKALGDTTRMLYWVTQSVINDIRLGVTDQGSIWELSNQLMLSGDLQRAYRYISYASQCANTFGARQRKWQVAPLMASLAGQYKSASESSHQRLTVSLCALSVLFVIALVLLLLTIKQRNHIRRTRNLLYQSNANLQETTRDSPTATYDSPTVIVSKKNTSGNSSNCAASTSTASTRSRNARHAISKTNNMWNWNVSFTARRATMKTPANSTKALTRPSSISFPTLSKTSTHCSDPRPS